MAPRSAKSPRRHAKQERAHVTLGAILEAAARVLVREGYAGATTNRIAEVAGVSVGTLYQYFAHKDDVFDALIRRETAATLRVIDAERPDPRETLAVALRRVFVALTAAQPLGPDLYRQLEYVPNALLRRRVTEGKQHVVVFVRSLLEAHRSELRAGDLDLAALVLVNATEGVAMGASAELFGERLSNELTTLFTRYLLKP